MALSGDIRWLKQQIVETDAGSLEGTPLTTDLICSIALQETGFIWRKLRAKNFTRAEILRLCVGDVIDAPRRKAFPKNKAALVAEPQGAEMFALAHELLLDVADATGFSDLAAAARNPNKFVRGYGMFQRDLQFFKQDPSYFLQQKWADFGLCLDMAVKELKKALGQLGLADKPSLTDRELVFVAIVYNTGFGNFNASRGEKQGFQDADGVFYGEHIARLLAASKAVPMPVREVALAGEEDLGLPPAPPPAGEAAGAPVPPAPPIIIPSVPPAGEAATRGLSIVDNARGELARFGGIDEGRQPLRARIAEYVAAANGHATFDPTQEPWSAAFVSFCARRSGALEADFKFNLAHSQFVFAAIRNAQNERGLFRGRRIGEHAPRLGDIIQNNRSNQSFSFEFVRSNSQYTSHSGIVCDFEVRAGVRGAVTIGGNEDNTVGTRFVPLTPDGFIQQRARNPFICVIENRMMLTPPAALLPGRYQVRARPTLNLRGGPGTGFRVKQKLPLGTLLQVVDFVPGDQGLWALVDLENDGARDGFAFSPFLVPA